VLRTRRLTKTLYTLVLFDPLETEILLNYFIGGIAILIGVGLVFAKIDEEELKLMSKLNPMGLLFRYSWWRYGNALVAFGFGFFWVCRTAGWGVQ